MNRVLKMRLTGGDARLGSVPASDVGRLLVGVERVVARAAGDVSGRRVKQTGRWRTQIKSAAQFRLRAIGEGSVVVELELPDIVPDAETLDSDASTLGQLGLASALKTIAGDTSDADIAAAFVKLADEVGIGSRYDALEFDTELEDAPRHVKLDVTARNRLQDVAARAEALIREDSLVGVLVEADFEKLTARLRSPDGESVIVDFEEDLADELQAALRSPAQLSGEIVYNPETSRAERVELRAITRAEQLSMGLDPGDFWDDVTIETLRRQNGVEPSTSETVLHDPDLTDDEADAFLAALTS